MRDSMVFYRSFHEATKDLPPDIYKEAMVALMDYALDGKIGELSPFANMFLQMAKPQVDANNQKYANGCKGGRKASKAEEIHSDSKPSEKQEEIKLEPIKNQEETKPEPNLTKAEPNDNVYDNENVNVNDNTKTMCTADADALFERLWNEYPVKKGKGQVSAAQKKRLLAVGEAALLKAIERYRAELAKDSDWRKAQNGSTFFNSGYVDYLDENFVPDKFRAPKKQDTSGNKFCNFAQRETDYDTLVMDQVHGWLDQAKGA